MIALHFGMKLNEVEEINIADYRLMLFTLFNNAVLHGFDPSGFKYQTPNEESEFIWNEAQRAIKGGYSL